MNTGYGATTLAGVCVVVVVGGIERGGIQIESEDSVSGAKKRARCREMEKREDDLCSKNCIASGKVYDFAGGHKWTWQNCIPSFSVSLETMTWLLPPPARKL